MSFMAIPLAAALMVQPAIRPLSAKADETSRMPAVGTLQNGGRVFVVLAVIRAAAAEPPRSDPSYLGIVGVDRDGRRLVGAHRYRLHFTKDELPPAGSLWSLAALQNDPFRSGKTEEGMLGQGDDLRYNPDRSLDIYLQREPPPGERRGNWLRIPSGAFNLVAHARWPGAESVKGEWKVPSVERVD
jgi:hypothetical protein